MLRLIQMGMVAIGYACAATLLAEAVALFWMWNQGLFSLEKRQKLAAVAYGFDLSRWDAAVKPSAEKTPKTEKDLFLQRVREIPILQERQRAAARAAEELRGASDLMQIDQQDYELLRKKFADHLRQLEDQVQNEAITHLRTTLEVLPAKQSKDLILEMLGDTDSADAMDDLLKVLRAMPLDRSKKILGEFKSDEEAQTLHQILVELGDLAERTTGTSQR